MKVNIMDYGFSKYSQFMFHVSIDGLESNIMGKNHVFWKNSLLLGVFHVVNFHFLQNMFHVFKFMHCIDYAVVLILVLVSI